MADTFKLRHKVTGFITEPVTAEQAKTIANLSDYEKIVPPKPLIVKEAGAKKPAAPRKPAGGKGKATATKPKPTPAPTPAPAPAGGTDKQD